MGRGRRGREGRAARATGHGQRTTDDRPIAPSLALRRSSLNPFHEKTPRLPEQPRGFVEGGDSFPASNAPVRRRPSGSRPNRNRRRTRSRCNCRLRSCSRCMCRSSSRTLRTCSRLRSSKRRSRRGSLAGLDWRSTPRTCRTGNPRTCSRRRSCRCNRTTCTSSRPRRSCRRSCRPTRRPRRRRRPASRNRGSRIETWTW